MATGLHIVIHSIHVSYNTLTSAFTYKIPGGSEASTNGKKLFELESRLLLHFKNLPNRGGILRNN
jgi:hypothetical protein